LEDARPEQGFEAGGYHSAGLRQQRQNDIPVAEVAGLQDARRLAISAKDALVCHLSAADLGIGGEIIYHFLVAELVRVLTS
jgi:hypothetical protein